MNEPTSLGSTSWEYAIERAARSGAENMATDTWLLQHTEPGVGRLRLYRWNPPCLSLGRNEPALRRYGREAVRTRGLPVVRRPTGGRAVWHESELTYAIAASADLFGTLADTYICIHQVLARALRDCGAAVELAVHRPVQPLGSGPCFAAPVGGEIIGADGKVVGSAQVREGSTFLQHGSVLLGNRQEVVSELIGDNAIRAVAANELVDRQIAFEELAEAIVANARDTWGGSWTERAFRTPKDLVEHFQDDDWTWRR